MGPHSFVRACAASTASSIRVETSKPRFVRTWTCSPGKTFAKVWRQKKLARPRAANAAAPPHGVITLRINHAAFGVTSEP